jgi:hypothetical protein
MEMKGLNMDFFFKKDKFIIKKFWLLLILLFGILPLFQFHVGGIGYLGFGGLFTPDTIGMQSTINAVAQGADINYRTIFGVVILYYPSYWLGNIYSYFINCMLLFFSWYFFIKAIPKLHLNLSQSKAYMVFFMVIANFYILSLMLHPNKEIPLIFLTNAFVYYAVIKQKILLPMLIIAISATFRDGYGIILLLTLIALNIKIMNNAFHRRPYLVSIILALFLSIFALKELSNINILSEFNYILERNISSGLVMNSALNELPSYQAYTLKLVNNLFNAALRPQFIDLNSRIYFTGIGLWQFGVISILGVLSWLYIIRGKQDNSNFSKLTLAILICLLLISYGSFTQSRYLMPYIFWLSAGFISILKFDLILIFFLGFFLLSLIFSFSGLGVLTPLGIDIYPVQAG